MEYLKDAATRMPRLDWRNALLGIFLSAVVYAILPSDAVRDALQMIFRVIAVLYGHDLPAIEREIS